MSVETKSIISVRDSTATINQSSELVVLQTPKHYCISSRSALISTFALIIVFNFISLGYPIIYVFDNGVTLNTVNALLATVGIYFIVKKKVGELPIYSLVFTADILINLALSIAKLVYVNTSFCSDQFMGEDLDNCYSQAKVHVVVASVTCALAILILGTTLYNLYDHYQILKSRISTPSPQA